MMEEAKGEEEDARILGGGNLSDTRPAGSHNQKTKTGGGRECYQPIESHEGKRSYGAKNNNNGEEKRELRSLEARGKKGR